MQSVCRPFLLESSTETDMKHAEVDDLIQRFNLKPHPEGGFFSEVYRSPQTLFSECAHDKRSALTHIYFLLGKGQVSRFHRVLHEEVWNFYEGSPLRLVLFNGTELNEVFLGGRGNPYVKVVPGGSFQAAETLGDYSLVGCSVAPGFDFRDFTFLQEGSDEAGFLKTNFIGLTRFF